MITDYLIVASMIVIVGLIVLYVAGLLFNTNEKMTSSMYMIIYTMVLFITGNVSYLILNYTFC